MSEEVLSRSDVEDLLKSMDSGTTTKPSSKPEAAKKAVPKARILAYDFKRPERVGKEQMRALQSLHEGLGRNLGLSFSSLANDYRSQVDQCRPIDLQRVRLQFGDSDLLQSLEADAVGGKLDSRYQPFPSLSDYRSNARG